MNFSAEEIWLEDIEPIESEQNGSTRKTHLIVKLKDQPFGKDLGTVWWADELVENSNDLLACLIKAAIINYFLNKS